MIPSVLVPLELDHLLHGVCFEDLQLFGLSTELHQGDVVIVVHNLTIFALCHVHGNLSEQVDGVFDLCNLFGVITILLTLILVLNRDEVGEDLVVTLSDVKEGTGVGSDTLLVIVVISWPSIEIENHAEHLAVKKVMQEYSLVHENWQILQEHIAADIVVLILDNISNQQINSLDLIILKSILDSIGIVIPLTILLEHLVLIDDGELL